MEPEPPILSSLKDVRERDAEFLQFGVPAVEGAGSTAIVTSWTAANPLRSGSNWNASRSWRSARRCTRFSPNRAYVPDTGPIGTAGRSR
jgi:hypothetical protein